MRLYPVAQNQEAGKAKQLATTRQQEAEEGKKEEDKDGGRQKGGNGGREQEEGEARDAGMRGRGDGMLARGEACV